MATDGPTPPPADREIFEKGEPVAALDARSNAAEQWVKEVAKKANARVDWHYSGGIAQVLHLGDAESRTRVHAAMKELEQTLDGRIIRFHTPGEAGLYRAGVTPAPTEANFAFTDPVDGQSILGQGTVVKRRSKKQH